MATTIKLKCGAEVLVDDEDAPQLRKYHWSLNAYGYVIRYEGSSRNKTQIVVWLHREIMRAPKGMDVDHKHGNKLDNRKSELRLGTRSQNLMNSKKHEQSSSRFKGVFWFKRDGKWAVQICINGVRTHIGYFTNEVEAARAYDRAALDNYGEFARINFSDTVTLPPVRGASAPSRPP